MKCENNFMLRIPYHSYHYYEKNIKDLKELNYKDLIDNFSENLLVSTPSLHTSLYSKKGIKDNELMSLIKYLIRSSTRCTPYGLTSGVLKGEFGDSQNYIINKDFKKSCRPDMSWLVSIIKMLEDELNTDLKVIVNNMSSEAGDLILKKWNSCFIDDLERQGSIIHINNTNAVKYVFQVCGDYISIKEIIKTLKEQSNNVNEKMILQFIHELIASEYLTSNLRSSLLINRPLDYIIDKIEEYRLTSDLAKQLHCLQKMLQEYEEQDILDGEQFYNEIIDYMKSIHKCDNYLQVDMFNKSNVILPQNMKENINEFIDFLSQHRFCETYHDYALKFKERYGNQAVKYLDLIDEEKGLGIPKSDDKNSLKFNDKIMCQFMSVLFQNKKDSIQLEDYSWEVSNLSNKYQAETDGELAFYMIGDEGDDYKFVVSPLMGSNTEYKTSGRFEYLFDNNQLISSNKIIKEVETTFVPQSPRFCNVMMCQTNKSAYLEYGTNTLIKNKERVDINDVYVIVDNENYIRFVQKSTGEILEFFASNMFNIDGYPQELKCLLEITNKQKLLFTSFYTTMQHYLLQIDDYLPRISYKEFILFPASFSLKNINLSMSKEQIMSALKSEIKKIQKDKQFSELISVGPLDQRLLLNVNNYIHLEILYELLRKDTNLKIYENLFNCSRLPIVDKLGEKYVAELVFNISNTNNEKSKKLILPKNIPFLDNSKYLSHSKMPFEDCLSVKLYANEQLHDKILIEYISKLNNTLIKEKNDISIFYIRYKDPQSHIRLRIKYSQDDMNFVGESLGQMIQDLKSKNLIYNCVIDTYFQEYERYGGENNYKGVEHIFSADSHLAIGLLKLKEFKLTELTMTELFILSSYKLLEDLGLDSEEKLYYLDNFNIGKKFNNDFKVVNRRLKNYLISDNMWEGFRSSEEGIRLLTSMERFEYDFGNYWRNVEKNSKDNIGYKKGILLSLLHMQFNRMIGVNRELEIKVMGYLRKIVYNQAMKEKYYAKI